ncbi:ComF family protein [Marinobacter shengliensis]|jgi:ComF family protein|uniref:ComF family protein n=1 Tax=Marinobacter shengliensis TaxID=1389223 RepID=UPI0025734704|nr:ComF family protein [Marinobacter shengliensis]BEH15366.1 amidophosphoribosyltransferase [Marinobacter shengliensis]
MINGLNPLSTFIERKVNSVQSGGRCVSCLSPHAHHGLCTGCRDDLPANRWHCHSCALPLAFATPGMQCGECQTLPPPFSRSLIPWRYQYPVDGMIGRYKYQGHRKFARPLLAGFASFLDQNLEPEQRPDVLIPAPMHWLRRWQRGFNQAQDIAEFVGARLDIPVAAGVVRRSRRVKAQRSLNRAARLQNLRDVFEVRGVVPERVAIVDDVVTTGATVRVLASALKEAGAADIQVWALARTPG